MTDQDDPRLRLIWEEGVRAVDLQSRALDELRARAATLLSAASIAAAFLAATALDRHAKFRGATWVGTVAFAVVGLAAIWVLWPRGGWTFHRRPLAQLANYVEHEEPYDIDDMHSDLARQLAGHFEHNAKKMRSLYWGVSVACAALVLEILAFLWDLRGRR